MLDDRHDAGNARIRRVAFAAAGLFAVLFLLELTRFGGHLTL